MLFRKRGEAGRADGRTVQHPDDVVDGAVGRRSVHRIGDGDGDDGHRRGRDDRTVQRPARRVFTVLFQHRGGQRTDADHLRLRNAYVGSHADRRDHKLNHGGFRYVDKNQEPRYGYEWGG